MNFFLQPKGSLIRSKTIKVLLFMSLTFIFSGCWKNFTDTFAKQFVQDINLNDGNKVMVSVVRKKQKGFLNGFPVKIYSGENLIGILSKRKYLTWQEPPGQLEIRAVYFNSRFNDQNKTDKIVITKKAGESLVIEQSINSSIETVKLQVKDENYFQKLKKKTTKTAIDIKGGQKCSALHKLNLGMTIEEVENILGYLKFQTLFYPGSTSKTVEGHYTTGKIKHVKRNSPFGVYECLLSFKNNQLSYIYSDRCLLEISSLNVNERSEMSITTDEFLKRELKYEINKSN